MSGSGIRIVGGGLAGLSLAIGLRRRGVAVEVHEAGRYPRHRVCGEFVSGVTDETLDRLGVAECFAGFLPRSSLRWHCRDAVVLEGSLPVPARAISRHLLDERLACKLLELGGKLTTGARMTSAPGEGWVWAAGRPKQAGAKRIGLKAHVRGIELAADLEMHSGGNGYAGLTAVEDGWMNVCGIFGVDREIRASGGDLLPAYLEAGGNGRLADRLRGAEWREGSFSAVAGFAPGRQPERVGELCIGEAGLMIPPFTGNGMSMAFEAADAALEPLHRWAEGRVGWQATCHEVRRTISRRFRKRMLCAPLIEPMITRKPVCDALRSLAAARVLPLGVLLSFVR